MVNITNPQEFLVSVCWWKIKRILMEFSFLTRVRAWENPFWKFPYPFRVWRTNLNVNAEAWNLLRALKVRQNSTKVFLLPGDSYLKVGTSFDDPSSIFKEFSSTRAKSGKSLSLLKVLWAEKKLNKLSFTGGLSLLHNKQPKQVSFT